MTSLRSLHAPFSHAHVTRWRSPPQFMMTTYQPFAGITPSASAPLMISPNEKQLTCCSCGAIRLSAPEKAAAAGSRIGAARPDWRQLASCNGPVRKGDPLDDQDMCITSLRRRHPHAMDPKISPCPANPAVRLEAPGRFWTCHHLRLRKACNHAAKTYLGSSAYERS